MLQCFGRDRLGNAPAACQPHELHATAGEFVPLFDANRMGAGGEPGGGEDFCLGLIHADDGEVIDKHMHAVVDLDADGRCAATGHDQHAAPADGPFHAADAIVGAAAAPAEVYHGI